MHGSNQDFSGGVYRHRPPISARKLRRSRSGGAESFYGESRFGGIAHHAVDADDVEDDWDSEMQISDYLHSVDASPVAMVCSISLLNSP